MSRFRDAAYETRTQAHTCPDQSAALTQDGTMVKSLSRDYQEPNFCNSYFNCLERAGKRQLEVLLPFLSLWRSLNLHQKAIGVLTVHGQPYSRIPFACNDYFSNTHYHTGFRVLCKSPVLQRFLYSSFLFSLKDTGVSKHSIN